MKKTTLITALLSSLLLIGCQSTYPVLSPADNASKQGFIGKKLAVDSQQFEFIGLDDKDISILKSKNTIFKKGLKLEYTPTNKGIHYLAFDKDITFKEVLHSLKYKDSLKDTKFAISYYDAGERRHIMTHNDFFPDKNSIKIKLGDEDKHTIKAGKVFTFLATDTVEIIGATDGSTPVTKLPKLCEAPEGWHQIVLPSNNLTENLRAYDDYLEKLFIQRSIGDPNDYTPVPPDVVQDKKDPILTDYYMVWIRLEKPPETCKESPTTQGVKK